MYKIILHLDMNSYFASVEQQANPLLRGRPVGVCEHLYGIIIAPSVEAKRLGIKLGTPVWEALKIYPKIVLLPTDPDKYRYVTNAFVKILSDYSDAVERYSIDEAFLDVSEYCRGSYDDALLLALEIKQRMRQEVGEWVSCSIGLGPNRLLSKIAADLGEGDIDRICIIKLGAVSSLYQRLKLTDVPGIGPRLKAALNKLGIFSLKQLAEYQLGNLLTAFGFYGYVLKQLALFKDISDFGYRIPDTGYRSPTSDIRHPISDLPKSIGHMYTLPRPISRLAEIKGLLMKLSEKVGRRLRRQQARAKLVHYFHSDKTYYSFHKQRTLPEAVASSRDIYKYAVSLMEQGKLGVGVKIVGVSVGNLDFTDTPEPLLPKFKKPLWTAQAADQLNDKYGEFTICPARMLGIPGKWAKDTVGFGRMRS